jgi:hypothetical protein
MTVSDVQRENSEVSSIAKPRRPLASSHSLQRFACRISAGQVCFGMVREFPTRRKHWPLLISYLKPIHLVPS